MNNIRTKMHLLLAAALLAAVPAQACIGDSRTQDLIAAWQAAQPVRGLNGLAMHDATCMQDALVRALQPRLGMVAGYKAGLTSKAVQQRFGHAAPVRGVLLERMLRAASANPVTPGYGARPVIEADLLVEVRDDAINLARTHLEALASLSKVYPFIELADLVLAEGETVSAAQIVAINVGARGGVFGTPLAVEATQAFADALRDMRVVMRDETEKPLSDSTGAAILGHPLNAVLWLVQDLNRSGVRLRAGDLLSLGAFAAPVVPRQGARYAVSYHGLPGDPEVMVRFK